MLRGLRWLAMLTVLAACGARTGLLSQEVAPGPIVTFDAGSCHETPWLLFDVFDQTVGATSGIYAMRADGTSGHFANLPHGPGLFPSVSPDGSKLLYATFLPPDAAVDGGVDSALYLYDFGSHTDSLVVTTSQLSYSALSPDGRTVAYTTGYSLAAIAPDGTHDRTLLSGTDVSPVYGHPVFEPDSQTVVYGAMGVLGSVAVDGSRNETLLTAIPDSFQFPNAAFSPDYQQLVLGAVCSQGVADALMVYPFASLPGASCQSGQILTDVNEGASPNSANDPSWGPTGLIAYASAPDVYVTQAAGGAPTDVTANLTGDAGIVTASDPVWAPACAEIP